MAVSVKLQVSEADALRFCTVAIEHAILLTGVSSPMAGATGAKHPGGSAVVQAGVGGRWWHR